MKVILLEDVFGAGNAGDVVEVKNGYARNKLLPSGLAIEANKTNMKTLEHRRAKIAAKRTADKEMAQSLAAVIDGKQIDFTAKAGDSGKLFGSITTQDIANAVNETLGFEIDRRKVLLDAPLKEVGLHDVRYRIYPEVEAVLKVNIMPEGGVVRPKETLKDTYSDQALERDEDVYPYDQPEGAPADAAVEALGDEAVADEAAEEGNEAVADDAAEDAKADDTAEEAAETLEADKD